MGVESAAAAAQAVTAQAVDPVTGAAGNLAQGVERFGVVYILCAVIVALVVVVGVLWRKLGKLEDQARERYEQQLKQNEAAAELTKKLADGQIEAMRGELAALRARGGGNGP